jgi:hypothetical protein
VAGSIYAGVRHGERVSSISVGLYLLYPLPRRCDME